MENWVLYNKYFYALWEVNKSGVETNARPDFDKNHRFYEDIDWCIKRAKIFNIDDDVKKLLCLTKPPNKNDHIRLPYTEMFVDVKFTRAEVLELTGKEIEGDVIGFLVQEGIAVHNLYHDDYTPEKEKTARTIRIIPCVESADGYTEINSMHIEVVSVDNLDDYDVFIDDFKGNKRLKRFLNIFTINLMNLINDPEIEVVQRAENRERNQKRVTKGKVPIPETNYIKLDSKRRIYLDNLYKGEHFTYGYKFWVRGHWRVLTADKYKTKRRIWIMPFIKGKGILIEKEYEVLDGN